MTIVVSVGSQRHNLTEPRSRLGRSPQCEVLIPGGPESVVSWEHACLESAGGLVIVSDLGSTNGTFVNGVKLEPHKRLSVTVGDRIRFGTKGPEVVIESITTTPVLEPIPQSPPMSPVRDEYPDPTPAAVPPRPPEPSRVSRRPNQPTNTQLHRAVEQLRGERRTATVVAVVGVAVCLLAVGLVLAISYLGQKPTEPILAVEPPPPPPPPPPTDAERYEKLMRSAVWIETHKRRGNVHYTGRGSGSYIQHGDQHYILTAAHVIDGADTILVTFPRKIAADSDWEKHPKVYHENKWQLTAEVVRSDTKVDLAILRLKVAPPKDAVPLKLAGRSPKVSDWCATIGNQSPEGELHTGALWAFKIGKVAQLDYKRMASLGIESWMIQTSILINQGDSGGALVNEHDEVIGVNSCGLTEKAGTNIYRSQLE